MRERHSSARLSTRIRRQLGGIAFVGAITLVSASPGAAFVSRPVELTYRSTTPVGAADDVAFAAGTDKRGRVLAAGFAGTPSGTDVAVVRYRRDGAIDRSFGSDGRVIWSAGPGNDQGRGITTTNNNGILVAGVTFNGINNDVLLMRLTDDGQIDPSFGTNGRVITPVGSGIDVALSVAEDRHGRIVVAGFTFNGANLDILVMRYSPNGALDPTFGAGGIAVTGVGAGDDIARSVAVGRTGDIYVAGVTLAAGGQGTDFALLKYSEDGSLDNTFGSHGIVATSVSDGIDNGRALSVLPNGSILLAGETVSDLDGSRDFALLRYTSEGVLDEHFGQGGIVTSSFGRGTTFRLRYCIDREA